MTYMKKEAVMTRPIASMKTARVGYHSSGTGLDMGFTDWPCFNSKWKTHRVRDQKTGTKNWNEIEEEKVERFGTIFQIFDRLLCLSERISTLEREKSPERVYVLYDFMMIQYGDATWRFVLSLASLAVVYTRMWAEELWPFDKITGLKLFVS